MGQDLTDAQLQELANDPRLTAADMALLSPSEKAALAQIKRGGPGIAERTGTMLKDLGVGAAKGLGESITEVGNFGRAMIPGLNKLDTLMEPVEFSTTSENTAQSVGKTAERIAEFFVPAGAMRKAGVKAAVHAIPNSLSAPHMKIANKLAALLGRSAGEGASAAGVAALHGDESPETAGMIGAAGPAVGSLVGTAAKTLKNPMVSRLAPYLTASAIMGASPNVAGVSGALSGFGLVQALARQAVKNPRTIPMLQDLARRGVPRAAELLAALESEGMLEP